MVFLHPITNDAVCDDPRDPDALMRNALADWQLFKCGALTDDDGRQFVVTLLQLGYPLIPAMRVALGLEQRHD